MFDIMRALFTSRSLRILLRGRPESTKEKDETVTSSGLYYHLSELKNAGIVEVTGYIEQKEAPQKLWKLKVKKLLSPWWKNDRDRG